MKEKKKKQDYLMNRVERKMMSQKGSRKVS